MMDNALFSLLVKNGVRQAMAARVAETDLSDDVLQAFHDMEEHADDRVEEVLLEAQEVSDGSQGIESLILNERKRRG